MLFNVAIKELQTQGLVSLAGARVAKYPAVSVLSAGGISKGFHQES